jgi:hypothetical protein
MLPRVFRTCPPPAEHLDMPDPQTAGTIPRPIAVVLQHHGELQTAYVRQRAAHDKTAAFVGAVSDVLTETEVSELSHLIAGSHDTSYDARRGAEFGQLLLDDLEQGYQDVLRIREQTRRWRDLDAPGVVQALATDLDLATLFVQALDERNDTTARALVSSAVTTVVEKASVTGNAPATRRAVEAAAAEFRRRSTDGLGDSPQLALLDHAAEAEPDVILAAWCEALYVGLGAAS